MELRIPELALVVLIGASGSGKSTFAARHFKPTEVLSSDYCRGLVADDENDQTVTKEAFEVLNFIAAKRLEKGRLVVVDATNVQAEARKPLLQLAREHHVIPVAIVLNMPERLCHERNSHRPERAFGPHVIRNQLRQLRSSMKVLKREGWRHITVLNSPEEADQASISRQPMWTDKRHDNGPFDIIGDVHGCFDELRDLLTKLGYHVDYANTSFNGRFHVQPPPGRRVLFLGDLVDRGPASHKVLRLAMDMVAEGHALCVPGNHEIKLLRKLNGKNVKLSHGLSETLQQLDLEPPEFIARTKNFIEGLVSHYVLDQGRLVVAHAGMKEAYQGRGSGTVRSFALYGETTGETDEFGLPVRYNWAAEYRGKALVVYGHTPVAQAEWLNNTICIDTGCVFGGQLSALRYPERELVQVPAQRVYYEPIKPLTTVYAQPVLSAQHAEDDMLDIDDVLGKRYINTFLNRTVVITEPRALTALEALSRFGVHPKWLNYLPPTMSPSETSQQADLLEHPAEALGYYRAQGINRVICQEKHMGSRAVVQVCRDAEAAQRRFGVTTGATGIIYTRTGRRFFNDVQLEQQLLERLRQAATKAGLWDELNTDWMTLDCELMPWSAKAMSLLREQYSAVGAAGRAALAESVENLQLAQARGLDITALLDQQRQRLVNVERYEHAYNRYCWPLRNIDDLRLAPFHLLASEAQIHSDKTHRWHMDVCAKLAASGDSILLATDFLEIATDDPAGERTLYDWWRNATDKGSEGIVVKPLDFMARGPRGPVQPGIKCRGPEYLRIIYGPDYNSPSQLYRLRKRGLSGKRQLALREFTLGLEGLHRFVAGEPLRRVHECALGVLALESEPLDPRL